MAVRGVRGATTVDSNTKEEIVSKTREMLEAILEKNNIPIDEIASAIFSVTDDIDAEFPAVAARGLGWIHTPLFCTREIPVAGSLKSCVRVILHVNTEMKQDEMTHVYLHGAKKLRPDLQSGDKDRNYFSRS
ncbi:MAG: chorismate mutase [Spirochaetes bacterium]|jgi:chorismate mutase|nr:chorismate mutase [Spirochaetota bacterium]